MMKRKREHDCQCSHCKNHICSVIYGGRKMYCSDTECDNNIDEFKEKFEKLKEVISSLSDDELSFVEALIQLEKLRRVADKTFK